MYIINKVIANENCNWEYTKLVMNLNKKYLYYLIVMHLFYIINVSNMYKAKYGGENGRISEAS